MDAMTGEEIATKLAGDLLGISTDENAWFEPMGEGATAFFYNRRGKADSAMRSETLAPFTTALKCAGVDYHVSRLPYAVQGSSPQVTVVLAGVEGVQVQYLARKWLAIVSQMQDGKKPILRPSAEKIPGPSANQPRGE